MSGLRYAGRQQRMVLEKGPNGRNRCRRCGTEVAGRRITFCSDACVEIWTLNTSGATVRRTVFNRDQGVCALCGLDTVALADHIRTLRRASIDDWPEIGAELDRQVRALRVPYTRDVDQPLWDADHIVPVAEDGRNELANLRTLDLWCHRSITAAWHAQGAAARRAADDERRGVARPTFPL